VQPGSGLSRVFRHLPDADRAALRSLLATKWYPFAIGERLDAAIVAELGGGRADFFEKIGEASAEALLVTRDAEVFSVPDCATVVGWHRRALAMCGAGNPRVKEEECRTRGGAVCRYRLSWD
jgi:hypothetical protein